ncbi:MAG: heparan-alpha-glucosaminide N-acetyltransferase [Methanothrix sp.]|nr:heparan-alpha-glucosaminide N-acetyltransferase [Methanothrix sp.]MDD4447597.1 heparan-alpha-glucosaminide N-acetyltransferase [Methanothrix sp.]
MVESTPARFWEVDLLRGVAIVLMVLYHLIFDLNYFAVYVINVSSSFWLAVARLSASLFLLLVGLSLTLSHSRSRLLGEEDGYLSHLLKRSAWILGLALGVSVVTYLFIGRGFIVFGVLHLIGLSLLLAYPFLRMRRANFIFGLLFILLGISLQNIRVSFPWLLWLGLMPPDFYSVDYFPVFPWFGVILVGMGLGSLLYPGYRRRISVPDLAGSSLVRALSFLGRNSLAVYLVHQPVMIAIFYLSGISLTWH